MIISSNTKQLGGRLGIIIIWINQFYVDRFERYVHAQSEYNWYELRIHNRIRIELWKSAPDFVPLYWSQAVVSYKKCKLRQVLVLPDNKLFHRLCDTKTWRNLCRPEHLVEPRNIENEMIYHIAICHRLISASHLIKWEARRSEKSETISNWDSFGCMLWEEGSEVTSQRRRSGYWKIAQSLVQ
jgi:hypothetical protein